MDKFNYLCSLLEKSAYDAIAGLTIQLWRSNRDTEEMIWKQMIMSRHMEILPA